ncbi:redox-sensing transcriptional repressor Rex [Ruminococcus sp. XPD3002]|uniref:redox-sensing transcriptional repressor Rex n=1 Tax=Ruminococcus sp. XPD3002 TaxID=1452269 RepID=UPI00091698D7|nr:redox-sensing transcriptional repressor Rex [Ruminococcus sp.]SFX22738.1 redox-sensing transcriptional repressor [Ruminococcus flavefaciens]HPY83975.1 redox-sensing transcriptional repressor Rex [Ruminococcus flavefaciens]HRU95860.1 redox-sensing transcriptional repressor Rex [Ruminococcus sp.]
MSKNAISNSVIRRLPRYYRFLGELENNDYIRISSRELAEKMGLTASQIRQDFNCFGEFGQQGYGYNVSELRTEIGKILGLDSLKPMILLGAGNLGSAIAAHLDFKNRGFELIGIFDANKSLVGKEIGELKVTDIEELEDFCKERSPEAAILCIPKDAAVTEAEILISYGIKAFWNFTHYDLKMAYKDVIVENVHLGDSLTTLSYCINSLDKK